MLILLETLVFESFVSIHITSAMLESLLMPRLLTSMGQFVVQRGDQKRSEYVRYKSRTLGSCPELRSSFTVHVLARFGSIHSFYAGCPEGMPCLKTGFVSFFFFTRDTPRGIPCLKTGRFLSLLL